MNSAVLAWFWGAQYRIESRARSLVAHYRAAHKPITPDYMEGLLVAGPSCILAGIALGWLLWGGR